MRGGALATLCVPFDGSGDALGEQCAADAECDSETCAQSQCTDVCVSDSDCLTGQICTDVSWGGGTTRLPRRRA